MRCRANNFTVPAALYGALGIILWCAVFLPPAALAKEESFGWGQPVSGVMLLLSGQKKEFYTNEDYTRLTYSDRAFDKPCQVTLYFDSLNKGLEKVEMEWSLADIGERIKKTLTDGYGQPVSLPQEGPGIFVWDNFLDQGMTVLDCRGGKAVLSNYAPRETEEVLDIRRRLKGHSEALRQE